MFSYLSAFFLSHFQWLWLAFGLQMGFVIETDPLLLFSFVAGRSFRNPATSAI
jgi:hypothetical protein